MSLLLIDKNDKKDDPEPQDEVPPNANTNQVPFDPDQVGNVLLGQIQCAGNDGVDVVPGH